MTGADPEPVVDLDTAGRVGPAARADRRVRSPGRGKWLSPADREQVATALADRYRRGASIRELAKDTGFSFGRVRALLLHAGVALRARGGQERRRQARG